MNRDDSIYVAGHSGLVGSALVRRLQAGGFDRLVLRRRDELELTDAGAVERFFQTERPAYVFYAAGKVGGIQANRACPADFLRENLRMQTNVIDSAWRNGVRRLLFLGCACMYPKECPQPMREEMLLAGRPEPTNEAYAIAKLAGLAMCRAYETQHGGRFLTIIPCNLYGPNDNFDPARSHLIAAAIRRLHEAKERGDGTATLWGTGRPRREWMHADDAAEACLVLMRGWEEPGPVNAGVGEDLTILETATLVARVVGFTGKIVFDTSAPDGMERKLLDSTRLRSLGWRPRIPLEEGLRETYRWYVERRRAEMPSKREDRAGELAS